MIREQASKPDSTRDMLMQLHRRVTVLLRVMLFTLIAGALSLIFVINAVIERTVGHVADMIISPVMGLLFGASFVPIIIPLLKDVERNRHGKPKRRQQQHGKKYRRGRR